jgi:cell division protease FtsH
MGATELSRKMVREWGMSERIGPMAWGGQGQVFLGEDLMHSREYSDETARVIDEEVESILRKQEDRCRDTLRHYRPGLDAVASALLEHETIDGAEVKRLIDEAQRAAANGAGAGDGRHPSDEAASSSDTSETEMPAPASVRSAGS